MNTLFHTFSLLDKSIHCLTYYYQIQIIECNKNVNSEKQKIKCRKLKPVKVLSVLLVSLSDCYQDLGFFLMIIQSMKGFHTICSLYNQ